MIEFENWLEDLDIQTLTDELKKEILERLEDACKDAYDEGYSEAKDDMLNYLDNI
jgi:hypothetical protein